MVVEQNKLDLDLMCSEILQNMDVLSLQIQTPPWWPKLLLRAVHTATT